MMTDEEMENAMNQQVVFAALVLKMGGRIALSEADLARAQGMPMRLHLDEYGSAFVQVGGALLGVPSVPVTVHEAPAMVQ